MASAPELTPERTWPGLLRQLLAGADLSARDTAWVMDRVLGNDASDVQLAGISSCSMEHPHSRVVTQYRSPSDGRPQGRRLMVRRRYHSK